MLDRPLDNDYWDQNQSVLGMDEAGRGPIAGPLMVAGVIFPKGYQNALIDDSKKLSEKKRDLFAAYIKEHAIAYGIGIISPEKIDEINIYEATKLAMKEAINNVGFKMDHILIDAMKLDIDTETTSIIKGDAAKTPSTSVKFS